jgi:hypothetical protein
MRARELIPDRIPAGFRPESGRIRPDSDRIRSDSDRIRSDSGRNPAGIRPEIK